MALRETVSVWHTSMCLVQGGQSEAAIVNLHEIRSPSAKILHNIGCLHLMCGRPESALQSFAEAVEKDKYLAIAYYQRAFTHLHLKQYDRAELDLLTAMSMTSERGIDYSQLGARARLSQKLINEIVEKVRNCCMNSPSLQSGKIDLSTLSPISLHDCLFYPPKKMVENLVKKDFLGKAKVVSSTTESDIVYGMEKRTLIEERQAKEKPRQHKAVNGEVVAPPKPTRPPPRLKPPPSDPSRWSPQTQQRTLGGPLRRIKSADNILDSEKVDSNPGMSGNGYDYADLVDYESKIPHRPVSRPRLCKNPADNSDHNQSDDDAKTVNSASSALSRLQQKMFPLDKESSKTLPIPTRRLPVPAPRLVVSGEDQSQGAHTFVPATKSNSHLFQSPKSISHLSNSPKQQFLVSDKTEKSPKPPRPPPPKFNN